MACDDTERLERRRDVLRDELTAVGDLRPGTLVDITGRCGKPTCHCPRPADPGHRGWGLSRSVGGKRVNRGIPRRALDEVRAQLAEHNASRTLEVDGVRCCPRDRAFGVEGASLSRHPRFETHFTPTSGSWNRSTIWTARLAVADDGGDSRSICLRKRSHSTCVCLASRRRINLPSRGLIVANSVMVPCRTWSWVSVRMWPAPSHNPGRVRSSAPGSASSRRSTARWSAPAD